MRTMIRIALSPIALIIHLIVAILNFVLAISSSILGIGASVFGLIGFLMLFTGDRNMAWQILMTAETCNNVSRYDGVKYGHRAAQLSSLKIPFLILYLKTKT